MDPNAVVSPSHASEAPAPGDGGGLILETTEALAEFLAQLPPPGPGRRCAVDTEADSLHSYKEKLCLIQFGCAGQFAIIDPLRIKDLTPLLDFLKSAEIWMHGADFDMSLFKRTFDWVPEIVYDTQVAARLVGHRQFGLAILVEKVFGVVLSKQSQRANWGRRPLMPQMVEYAINDVRYILPMADILIRQLDEKGRRDWFLQSCRAARDAVMNRQPPDQEEAWRITGWGVLQPKGLAALRALWHWRNGEAEKLDRPAFKVINNEPLLGYAQKFQEDARAELPERFPMGARRRFHTALDAVRKMSPEEWPKRRIHLRVNKAPEAEPRFDHLRQHRDKVGLELDIEGSLVASRNVMEEVAADLTIKPNLLPWQLAFMQSAIDELPGIQPSEEPRGGGGRGRRGGRGGGGENRGQRDQTAPAAPPAPAAE